MARKFTLLTRLAPAVLAATTAFVPARATAAASINWQSAVKWHRLLKKSVPGTLAFDGTGVEFHSKKFSHRWLYREIMTFDLTGGRELTITDYENRHWHEPGDRTFHFTLTEPMPPATAAEFTALVGRPVINGAPEPVNPTPEIPILAQIPAHRRERFGGSNGQLLLREDGIDYVAANGRDGRSWRWSDIQTLANPDPWSFRVMAYREIVEFDLKQPLPREAFDRIWDRLYATDLNVAPPHEERHQ